MKNIIILIGFIFLFWSCQNNTQTPLNHIKEITPNIDTVYIKNDTINRTQIIPDTYGQLNAWELAGFWLKNVSSSECFNSAEPHSLKDSGISNLTYNDSILRVEFHIWDICGSDFLCDVDVENKNTLNLKYYQFNSWASCRCNYLLKFQFKIIDNGGIEYPYQIKYLTFNGKGKVKL